MSISKPDVQDEAEMSVPGNLGASLPSLATSSHQFRNRAILNRRLSLEILKTNDTPQYSKQKLPPYSPGSKEERRGCRGRVRLLMGSRGKVHQHLQCLRHHGQSI